MKTGIGTDPQRTAVGGGGGGDDSSSDHSCRSERGPPGVGRGPPRGGGGSGPSHRDDGNGNRNGDDNGDCDGEDDGEEGDQSCVSSHRGPPGP